ncbi:ATP-binding protein, partial [Candidatus Micrarchaeota archaeon]|nr:ATP-binding protein [Candidatus Micrarchaeota archaeon]
GLKLIYDTEKPKIITSGSSSLELKVNILPYLVGRAFTFDLLTFSFGEFLKSKDHSLARIFYEKNNSVKAFIAEGKEIGKPSFAAELANHFKEYAVFGGYPEAVMAPRDEKTLVIDSLRSTYLEKDVAAFFHVYDTSKFEDFVKVLAFQTANVLSVSVVAKELGIGLKKAEEFLEILQHTYLVRLLRPFHRNLSTEVRKSRKVYFLDLGLRNSVMGNFIEFDKREDQGKLLENFVFRELTASFGDWEIRYWRTTAKAEVDFVLMKGDQIVPIEVKAGGKPGKSFYSFCQTYKPKRAVIVTLDRFEKAKIGNTTVYYVPAFYL